MAADDVDRRMMMLSYFLLQNGDSAMRKMQVLTKAANLTRRPGSPTSHFLLPSYPWQTFAGGPIAMRT